jgi:hypothetical protein
MDLAVTFNQTQYQAVIDEINAGLVTLATRIGQIGPAASAATSGWWIPQAAVDGLHWCADQISRLASEILETLSDIVQGALAPLFFAIKSYSWYETISGPASGVAADVAPNTLRACYTWEGDAATAYSRATSTQTTAAAKIRAVGDSVAQTLTTVAAAGLVFYIAISVLLCKMINQVSAAIVGIGSGWFSWAGLALIAETIVVDGGMITAAVFAIGSFLTAQVTALLGFKGQLESNETFPSGHWPIGTV